MKTSIVKCRIEWADSEHQVVKLVDDPKGGFSKTDVTYNLFESILIWCRLKKRILPIKYVMSIDPI